MIWKESFFEGYLIAYIKLANRKRNVLVFPFCRITSEARIIGVLLIPFEKGMEKEYESSPMKSFCPSKKKCNLGGQLGDKFGEKRQIWTLKNKNLQIWALFIVLEIKQIMSNICRWYVFLCKKSLSHAESTFRCNIYTVLIICTL